MISSATRRQFFPLFDERANHVSNHRDRTDRYAECWQPARRTTAPEQHNVEIHT
jgi:hypothetical protein